jgi:hypothetical protein
MTRARTQTAKGKRGKPRAKRPSKPKARQVQARPARARRKPAPVVTSTVLGLRCHVREVLLLEESLVLVDDVKGTQFALPLPTLVGRDALVNIERNQAVWLSVGVEKLR